MKRSTFLATIGGLFSFLGFKKKEKWNYGHVSTELEPLKWVDRGTVEFGPKIPVTPYVNEATVFNLNSLDKVECSYIADEKFMVVELDTKTGEKKILRMYSTKDIRA